MIFDQAGRSYATARAHGGPAVLDGGWPQRCILAKFQGKRWGDARLAYCNGQIGFASMIVLARRLARTFAMSATSSRSSRRPPGCRGNLPRGASIVGAGDPIPAAAKIEALTPPGVVATG